MRLLEPYCSPLSRLSANSSHTALFGLVAYPAQGLYRSMHSLAATSAQSEILSARKDLAERLGGWDGHGPEEEKVIRIFDEVAGKARMYDGV